MVKEAIDLKEQIGSGQLLGEEAARTHAPTRFHDRDSVVGGEENDKWTRGCNESPAQLESAAVGQLEVDERDIGLRCFRVPYPCSQRVGFRHSILVAPPPPCRDDAGAEQRVVIDNQDSAPFTTTRFSSSAHHRYTSTVEPLSVDLSIVTRPPHASARRDAISKPTPWSTELAR